MRVGHKCTSIKCKEQQQKTKTAGHLSQRYKTHVYCTFCGTYWDRDPSRKGKKQYCNCCEAVCREGPRNGQNGAARYAKRRAARIANGETLWPVSGKSCALYPQVMGKQREHKSV